MRCHDSARDCGRRSQRHLAHASSLGAVGDRFLTCTELKLLSEESTCNINRTDLDICITQWEIYRMSIIMLIMRQKDLSSVYM